MTTSDPDRRLDGNALAGPLRELFVVDVSAALATCAHCDASGPLAEQPLYADAPASVLRCRDCGGVLLRYSADGDRFRADFSGLRLLVGPGPSTGRLS